VEGSLWVGQMRQMSTRACACARVCV
jgi:hypothetical protein